MSKLFSPLTSRGVTFRNRIGVSPMCMYSSTDGFASDWHAPHLVARAVGGAGLIIQEATAVQAVGRISPGDAGLWSDEQIPGWAAVVKQIAACGAVAGVQLAHAGIKASHSPPWEGGKRVPPERGGWQPVGVRERPFVEGDAPCRRLSASEIRQVVDDFVAAAERARVAGYKLVEIHGAHGYLLNSFYSPALNDRTDEFGGSWENRTRLILEVTRRVRAVLPNDLPLWVRLSVTDWAEDGWTIEDSVRLAKLLKDAGADCIDCSSGGAALNAKIPVGPGFQVPLAARVRLEAEIATASVGLITEAKQAEEIVASGKADFVLLGREFLRDPYWPAHAAKQLGVSDNAFKAIQPRQYARAW